MKRHTTTPLATNNLRPNKEWPSWDDTADIIAQRQITEDKKDSFRSESSNHFTNRASKQGE